jgi:deazaflavin-dependent oxidoreductase (nitroreductase family)
LKPGLILFLPTICDEHYAIWEGIKFMFSRSRQLLEKSLFRALNNYLEPLIRKGVGSPRLSPVGAIVLKTTGRKSGQTYTTPVLASEVTNLLLIGTVRPRSQWIKNLAVTPQTQVWLRGEPLPVTAYVIGPGLTQSGAITPASPLVRFLIERLRPLSKLTGASFAVLEKQLPRPLSSRQDVALQL